MTIERQVEEALAARLAELPELGGAQITASRAPAPEGCTKSEAADKASVVAIAAGFRQNDAFSLSLITVPVSVTVATRVEADPTSGRHDAAVEAIANLLSRWHKFGGEMAGVFATDKFLAGELRMDGGTARVCDPSTTAWTETLNFALRGAEKFPEAI